VSNGAPQNDLEHFLGNLALFLAAIRVGRTNRTEPSDDAGRAWRCDRNSAMLSCPIVGLFVQPQTI